EGLPQLGAAGQQRQLVRAGGQGGRFGQRRRSVKVLIAGGAGHAEAAIAVADRGDGVTRPAKAAADACAAGPATVAAEWVHRTCPPDSGRVHWGRTRGVFFTGAPGNSQPRGVLHFLRAVVVRPASGGGTPRSAIRALIAAFAESIAFLCARIATPSVFS